MLIESKSEAGHSSIFSIRQANFKSAHLLHKMAKGFIFNPTTVSVVIGKASFIFGTLVKVVKTMSIAHFDIRLVKRNLQCTFPS